MAFSGKLNEHVIIDDKEAIEELHNRSFYGILKNNVLKLSFPESAYLIYSGKIRVESEGKGLDFKKFFLKASSRVKNFELFYIVYKDLRERGYYVQPTETDFRVYPRGGHPGKKNTEFLVRVASERIPFPLSDLKESLETAENLKKRLVLAIVDEESDITYYEVKKIIPSGSFELKINTSHAKASLLEDRCMVWDSDASHLLHEGGFFGKMMDEGHLQLSLIESGYLLKRGILEIERNNKGLDFVEFSGLASAIESDFMVKYKVYEELRNMGLVPKTGFKFGTHFRAYKNFETLSGITHSDYLVHAIEHDHVFSLQHLSRSVRLAVQVRKEMIYAAVDSRVDFFTVGRLRL